MIFKDTFQYYKPYILIFLVFFIIKSNAQSKENIEKEIRFFKSKLAQNRKQSDSLLYYANKLLSYATLNKHLTGQFMAYNAMSSAENKKGNFLKSNFYNFKSISIANNLEKDDLKYNIFQNIATNYKSLKKYDSAIYYLHKTHGYHFSRKHFTFPFYLIKRDLGYIYFKKSELDSATIYFKEAIEGFKKLDHKHFLASTLTLLAEVNFQKKAYDDALVFVKESQQISEQVNYRPQFVGNYNLMGKIYDAKKDFSTAEKFYLLETKSKPNKNIPYGNLKEINEEVTKSKTIHNSKINHWLFKKNKKNVNNFTILSLILTSLLLVVFLNKQQIKKELKTLREAHKKYKKNTQNSIQEDSIPPIYINLKSGAIINCNEILYIKSDGHYIEFYLKDKATPEIDRNSLNSALNQVPNDIFVRIHKSFIVNIQCIRIINSTKVMLENGTWINLSRTYKQQLKELLHKE